MPPDESHVQDVACLRRKVADRGHLVSVVQVGQPGCCTLSLAEATKVVYVLSVYTEYTSRVVGAEFVRAEKGEVVSLGRIQLLDLESGRLSRLEKLQIECAF